MTRNKNKNYNKIKSEILLNESFEFMKYYDCIQINVKFEGTLKEFIIKVNETIITANKAIKKEFYTNDR